MKHPDSIFKFSDEDIAWAMAQLQRMEGLPGMPQTLEGLKSFAVAFLRIVGDQAAYEVEKYNVKESAWVKYPVEAVSRQETADWLIEKLLLSSERFPVPIVMRLVYEEKYLCADRDDEGMISGDFAV